MAEPNLETIKILRSIPACEKHLRISEGLKEYSALGGRWSDHSLYWSEECDDCAEILIRKLLDRN